MKDTLKTWRQRGADMRAMRKEAKSPNRSHCQNCGTKLEGEYCHVCGQAAKEPRRAVIGLVQDVFVETLAIDGKLFRTIALLYRAPGRLARRYLDGKRVRYSPPFRLYLFASVFFFLAAFWSLDDAVRNEVAAEFGQSEEQPVEESSEEAAAGPGESEADPPAAVTEDDEPLFRINGEDQTMTEAVDKTEFTTDNEWLKPYLERLGEAFDRASEDPRLFMAQLRENLPRFMLLAPVVYALTLMLLYIYRRKFFVYDHFVVSLYMHAALYAYLLLSVLLSYIPLVGGYLYWLPLIWGALQPLLVQRQAYGSNWVSVVAKWLVINVIYWMAMLFIVLAGLGYSLYQS
ncbi:MAG: DUF3667 domain-containing protein [Pseudomonadota bacterium]